MATKKQNTKRKKGKARNRKYDSAWKEVIERFFKFFLEFFFPEMYKTIDFTRKIEFPNTGLRQITAGSDLGDRVSDVLVKVYLKDGTPKYICILIHIEIQGQPRGDFMERMYIYNYRTFDKRIEKGAPVISAAILTDDNEKYRPDEYCVSFCGFELRMKIPMVKILDFKLKPEMKKKLEAVENPMSIVVKAQLKSLEVKKADEDTKFEATKELIRLCYDQGYSRDDVSVLVKFIEWVFRFSKAFEKRLKEEINKIEEEYSMPYLASWERNAIKEGVKQGVIQEKKRTAKEMLKKQIDLETVMKITGLDRKQVEKLLATSH
jgi:predicted transposase/invertase (TIGR01784 family)